MFILKGVFRLNVIKFLWFDEADLLELSNVVQEWVKNNLALLKHKSLFLDLRRCSMQIGDTVEAFLVFFTRNVLALSTTLFQPFSHLLWHILPQVSGS